MQLVVTKANSLQAFGWIKRGWRIFTLQPGPFMAMSGIVLAFSLLGQMVPAASFIIVFLLPFLTAGFYQCASKAEQGEAIQASQVFQYLNQVTDYMVFVRLALVSILVSLPASSFAMEIAESMKNGVPPTFGMMSGFVVFLALNFMLTSFAIAAAWVSPKTPVLTLVSQSFKACWVNVLPLTLYGILMAMIFLVSMPIILIGWLIAFAISYISFYQMFLDFYRPVQVEQDEAPETIAALNSDETDLRSESQGEKDTERHDAKTDEAAFDEVKQSDADGVEQEPKDRTDHRQD